jgi:hypothetical protein
MLESQSLKALNEPVKLLLLERVLPRLAVVDRSSAHFLETIDARSLNRLVFFPGASVVSLKSL